MSSPKLSPVSTSTCPGCGSVSNGKRFCTRCGLRLLLSEHKQEGAQTARMLLGCQLDRKYVLESQLGIGGAGIVYRARRLFIGDEVAIKILHPQQVSDSRAVERFRREAQAAARLKHPNVVSVFDFGLSEEGLTYLVMELVEGESLRALLMRQTRLPEAEAVEIAAQLCAALSEAHAHNVVHRDVKPENIIVQQTPQGLRVKMLDFGIATIRDRRAGKLTDTGGVLGTPHYMSPEQCLGEELDGRSDIYSLGIVLYEMLTGVVPFDSQVATAVVVHHVNQRPRPLREHAASVSPKLEAVVLRALEKNSAARPQNADEFAKELRAALGLQSQVRRTSPAANNLATNSLAAVPTIKELPAKNRNDETAADFPNFALMTAPTRSYNAIKLLLALLLLTVLTALAYRHFKQPVLPTPIVTPNGAAATAKAPEQTEQPVAAPIWVIVTSETSGVTAPENATGAPDRQMAVIAPSGQLALAYREGQFFGNGPAADLHVFSNQQPPLAYRIFVRNNTSVAWQRIDVNRSGFPQGWRAHDMGHHGVRQAQQVLIKNDGTTELRLDAVMAAHKDTVAAAATAHRHTGGASKVPAPRSAKQRPRPARSAKR